MDTLFESVTDSLTLGSTLAVIFTALGLGLLISIVYMRTHAKEGYSGGFTVTLIMLPVIIGVIILLVGNNVARAFSLAGAFSLIRFRSAPGDPKDIAYVFFTLGVGLACGMGYLAYAAVFAIIMCLVMVALFYTNFGAHKCKMKLKITLPEDVSYENLFDDVFKDYLVNYTFYKIKTTNYGSLYEVSYNINIKNGINNKEFLDKLRCRNNNLNVVLSMAEDD